NIIPTPHNYLSILKQASENNSIVPTEEVKFINHSWHIFQLNDYASRNDFLILTQGVQSDKLNSIVVATNQAAIFIEPGANILPCYLNAATGPIYISKGATIMEGSMIRGPFFLGADSVVKMGAKIYGATSIGARCVVGGEIKNSILFDNSNKAHDGYLGDSVLGEWCNLGAGTSNSNVKNTAGVVGYKINKDDVVGFSGNKGGLLMGDYSRSAINTSFNTGSVVGVCCNIFGEIMPPKFIENFTWGKEKYIFDKALKDINNWMAFKNEFLSQKDELKLKKLYEKI
ncbi:MAG: glucose-1-phosphate thymidylyltransferase, partial [Ferruginibacter sp.]